MKINLKQSLKKLNGSALLLATASCPVCLRTREEKPAILGPMIADALVRGYNDPRTRAPVEISGDDAVLRLDLALRIYNSDEIEFTAAEVVLIGELMPKAYIPLVSAQIIKMVEPKSKE